MMALTSLSQEIDDITECSICTEAYVNPKSLPCVHTFCLKCLETYVKDKSSGDKETCPVCRQEFVIPNGGVPKLPGNFFIDKMLKIGKLSCQEGAGKEIVNLMCDLCAEENESDTNKAAEWQCINCAENLCNQCCKTHLKSRSSKSHKVVEIGHQPSEEQLRITGPSFCTEHPDKQLELFCKDCRTVICLMCCVLDHKTHDTCDVNKVSEETCQNLQSIVDKISASRDRFLKKAEEMEQQQIQLLASVSEIESKIANKGREMVQLVEAHTNTLLHELENFKSQRAKEISLNKEEIQRHLMMFESFTKYSMEIRDMVTPAEIVRLADELKQRGNQLQCMTLNISPPPTIQFVASPSQDNLVGMITTTSDDAFGLLTDNVSRRMFLLGHMPEPDVTAASGPSVNPVIHHGTGCDGCEDEPIKGIRYKCAVCPNYDLCQRCKDSGVHREHKFRTIQVPRSFASFEPANPSTTSNVVHPTTTCDSCRQFPIRGIRYKCLFCQNYDLCGSCKDSGVHSEHQFLNLQVPMPGGLRLPMPIGHPPNSTGVLHPTTTCDGCHQKPLRGVRYKCLVCPNYDLCGSCKASGTHSEHNFKSIPVPLSLPFS